MASFTKNTLMDFARYRLAGGTDVERLGIAPYQIIKWEQDAIERLVRRDLMLDEKEMLPTNEKEKVENRANLYIVPFTVPIEDGIAELTEFAEDDGMIIEAIPLYGSVTHPDHGTLVYCKSIEELTRPKTRNFSYYLIRGNFLLTRGREGQLDEIDGELSVWSPRYFPITECPRSRREKLITIMVELFAEAINFPAAEAEAEK